MAYYSPALVLGLSFITIGMSSVHANDNFGTVTGTSTNGFHHNPIAKVHVSGDLSKCQLPNFNQPPRSQPWVDAGYLYITLWCGPEIVDIGQRVMNPSGRHVDFIFDVEEGALTDQSPEFGKCFVTLTSPYNTACAAQLKPVDGGLDGLVSDAQQLLGGGDHQNDVPQYEANEFQPYLHA